jgi:hypothetical protein
MDREERPFERLRSAVHPREWQPGQTMIVDPADYHMAPKETQDRLMAWLDEACGNSRGCVALVIEPDGGADTWHWRRSDENHVERPPTPKDCHGLVADARFFNPREFPLSPEDFVPLALRKMA